MKLVVASDLHGSIEKCRCLLKLFAQEEAQKLLLLGDLFAYDSGGNLAEPSVADSLNYYATQIMAVSGNNDRPEDAARLDFPYPKCQILPWQGLTIFMTHGHCYHPKKLPPIDFDILLTGHTHVPCFAKHDNYLYLNPGALRYPRSDSKPSYLVMDNGIFTWKNLEGQEIMQRRLSD